MIHCKPDRDIVKSIETPAIVRLEPGNLFACQYTLMKLLPARFILEWATRKRLVDKDTVVIETTSGTFGLALAIVCALYGYKLILVSDPVIDASLKRRMEDLGATVDIVSTSSSDGGVQQARMERLRYHREKHPKHFWPSQYDNEMNPGAYASTAELLFQKIGLIDALIWTVGSGGSTCGLSSFIRMLMPKLHVIGVDTFNSVLFGHEEGKRVLRGLGNSLMPKNVDHHCYDEVHWVSAESAFLATRLLHQKHAVFQGPTSGAAYMVAKRFAEQNRDARVVCILPDEGYRYMDTIYNDDWIFSEGLWLPELPNTPFFVDHPGQAKGHWAAINWNRRSLTEVLSKTATV